MPDHDTLALPAVPFLQLGADGPFLLGSKCNACSAVMPGERVVCAACGARGQIDPIRLGERGKLYSFTVVYRSFPGTKTPFVAAIVDLEGGGSLKGTLVDITPDPALIAYDMDVDVVYRDTGQKNPEGQPFISYYFVPSQGDAR